MAAISDEWKTVQPGITWKRCDVFPVPLPPGTLQQSGDLIVFQFPKNELDAHDPELVCFDLGNIHYWFQAEYALFTCSHSRHGTSFDDITEDKVQQLYSALSEHFNQFKVQIWLLKMQRMYVLESADPVE